MSIIIGKRSSNKWKVSQHNLGKSINRLYFCFSELMPEDMEKRLLITVWNRNQKKRCNELLGCMSFGLHNVKNNKTVSEKNFTLFIY